jgi:hypothetical protein
MSRSSRLSKSRFVTGVQCHKLLWWTVHEAEAKELQPDKVLQDLFDQGRQVGEVARTRYPDGVLIDLPHRDVPARVEATKQALNAGARVVFEATFVAEGTYVAIDVLEKVGSGYRVTEVSRSIRNSPLRTIEISPPLNDGGGKCKRESKLKGSISPSCGAAISTRRLGCPRPGWARRSRWLEKSVGNRCTASRRRG